MNAEVITDFESENILDKLNKLIKELYGFESFFETELNKLLSIMEIYNNKKSSDDSETSKLRIGIMGQVNSGKSSFLNTLIFNGENVLPKDCISKTKIITKINYSNKKRIEVEFYTKKEWGEIKNVLIKEGDIRGVNFVKEILGFINTSEYDMEKYVNKDNEIIEFQNYDELLNKIAECDNNYRFPIKAMNIYIDDERLKNIEILDTPGVNDSNFIRKYTIDKCFKYVDVIFFLSQASIFLDDLDVNLISNQIPIESGSNVFLVASKYDNVIIDEGWKFKSLTETEEYVKLRLTNRARKYVSEYISDKTPIFMSAMANNLASKEKDIYNEEENYIITQLNNLWDGFIFNREKLMFISNFEDINNKINRKLYTKENLIAKLKAEVKTTLFDIKEKSNQRIQIIESSDMNNINIERENMKLKLKNIYKDIEESIEKIKDGATKQRKQAEKQLEFDFLLLSEINVKEKTIKIENESSKDNFKWYEGIFKKVNNEEAEDKFVDYKCVEIGEAINNINNFASNADVYLKKMLNDIMDFNTLQEDILKIVCENLDENFELNRIKEFVESNICSIKLSDINIDVDEYIAIIKSKFSDEIIGQAIEVLKLNLKAIMKKIYNEIADIVTNEFQLFIFQLDKAQMSIVKYVLEIINKRIESLKNQLHNLDVELKFHKKVVGTINSAIQIE